MEETVRLPVAKLLLVRHGDTIWSETGRNQGHTDIALSDKGLRQAERARQRLASLKIDAIYASDLQRAVATAQIIASQHEAEVTISSELREINFGELEGMNFQEIKQRYPQLDLKSVVRNPEKALPNGESLNQLAARVTRFLPTLEKHSPEETVLIVAHGGTIQTILCLLLGIGLEHWGKIRVEPASLTIMNTFPWGVMLSLLNDVCHLADLAMDY